jgi:hypothetical protein
MAFMKFLKGIIPPLLRMRLPARMKKGIARRVYELMVEKNSWAIFGTGNPIENIKMIIDPTLKAIARGEPSKKSRIMAPRPIYSTNSIFQTLLFLI